MVLRKALRKGVEVGDDASPLVSCEDDERKHDSPLSPPQIFFRDPGTAPIRQINKGWGAARQRGNDTGDGQRGRGGGVMHYLLIPKKLDIYVKSLPTQHNAHLPQQINPSPHTPSYHPHLLCTHYVVLSNKHPTSPTDPLTHPRLSRAIGTRNQAHGGYTSAHFPPKSLKLEFKLKVKQPRT